MRQSRRRPHGETEARQAQHQDANASTNDAVGAGKKGVWLQRHAVHELFLVSKNNVRLSHGRQENDDSHIMSKTVAMESIACKFRCSAEKGRRSSISD